MSETPTPTLAQIVAALAVSYTDPGIITWLQAGQRRFDRLTAATLIREGRNAEVAAAVAAIGDCDPADVSVSA